MSLHRLTSISHTWFCRCWHLLSRSCALSKPTQRKDQIKPFLSRNPRYIELCRCYLIRSEASVCPPRLKSFYPLEENLKWEFDTFDVRCLMRRRVCSPFARSPVPGSSLFSPAGSPAASWQTSAQSRSVEHLNIHQGTWKHPLHS